MAGAGWERGSDLGSCLDLTSARGAKAKHSLWGPVVEVLSGSLQNLDKINRGGPMRPALPACLVAPPLAPRSQFLLLFAVLNTF